MDGSDLTIDDFDRVFNEKELELCDVFDDDEIRNSRKRTYVDSVKYWTG